MRIVGLSLGSIVAKLAPAMLQSSSKTRVDLLVEVGIFGDVVEFHAEVYARLPIDSRFAEYTLWVGLASSSFRFLAPNGKLD